MTSFKSDPRPTHKLSFTNWKMLSYPSVTFRRLCIRSFCCIINRFKIQTYSVSFMDDPQTKAQNIFEKIRNTFLKVQTNVLKHQQQQRSMITPKRKMSVNNNNNEWWNQSTSQSRPDVLVRLIFHPGLNSSMTLYSRIRREGRGGPFRLGIDLIGVTT